MARKPVAPPCLSSLLACWLLAMEVKSELAEEVVGLWLRLLALS